MRNLSAQLVPAFRDSGSVRARTRRAELALLLLAVVVLAVGCSGPSAVSSARTPPAPSTPAAVPPATAFILTESSSSGESPSGVLSAVALRGGRVLWSASIPGQTIAGLVVARRLGRAYVLAGPPFTLTPVSLSTGTVGRPIRLGPTVWSVALAPDARHVYVSAHTRGGLTDTLYIASIATGTLTQARLTGEVVAFAPTPDGGTLWVAASTGKAEGETALLPVNAATGVPGPAVVDLPGGPVAIGL